MNLILIAPGEVTAHGAVELRNRRARHVRTVLGGRVGQSLRVGLINGALGTGMVKAVTEDTVTLRCVFNKAVPPIPPVGILLALPRPKVMKRLWAPLASLGVGRIYLTNARRVERFYFDTHTLQPEFYEPQLLLGLEQAGDTRLPQVTIHRRLEKLLAEALPAPAPDEHRWVAHPAGEQHIGDLPRKGAPPQRICLAVGPEGGWSARELQLLADSGFTPVTIGPRILRTDIACIALLGLAHEWLHAATALYRPAHPG